MGFNTIAVHGGIKDESKSAINPPVYLSSTFIQPDTETEGEYCYSRGNNPTRASVEDLAAAMEGAKFVLATSSGMAATSLVFELLKEGDKILINSNVYGGTWRFVSNLFENRGLVYEIVDDFNTYDLKDSDAKLVFIETPSNPLLEVTDIRRVCEAAHKKGMTVIVDNTFMTSYLQRPLLLGADIVIYSATKYYGGHSDLLAGLILLNDEKIYERFRFLRNTLGGILSPFDSFLLMRGMRTLALRLEKQQENAKEIAHFLESHDGADRVYYPGLKSNRGYEIQLEQAKGPGAVLSFELNETDYDLKTFVANLKYFAFAVSLGGVESLICRPSTMTHESYKKELQEKIGIRPNLLRLSPGIEDIDDLLDDLNNAFIKARRTL